MEEGDKLSDSTSKVRGLHFDESFRALGLWGLGFGKPPNPDTPKLQTIPRLLSCKARGTPVLLADQTDASGRLCML